MNNGAANRNDRQCVDQTLMAMREMERYCAAHPGAPVSLRHLDSSFAGAPLSRYSAQVLVKGIAGFGDTVQAALRAFDRQYLCSLTPAQREWSRARSWRSARSQPIAASAMRYILPLS